MGCFPLYAFGVLRPQVLHSNRHYSSFSTFRPRTSSLITSSVPSLFSPSSSFPGRELIWNGNPNFVWSKRIDDGFTVVGAASSYESSSRVEGERSLMERVELLGEALSTAFPVWVALGCLIGLLRPATYNWVQPKWTSFGITLTMLGMGMTLTFDDLCRAMAMPKELISAFFLQYTVMPISGFLVSKLLNLPSHYAVGLILVACCPGGTSSNIVTYIARGNVALSMLMTAASTMAAVIMIPSLTAKLAGQFVAVDAAGLVLSTLQIVLLPVVAGAFLNQCCRRLVRLVSPLMPPMAVGTVSILCGHAIAQSSSAILMSGHQILLATSLLHASGFFFGYVLARLLGNSVASSRIISIEVGMQNSMLGVVLATQHFGNPLTAVPSAVSSVCHPIFGSILAAIWRTQRLDENDAAIC